MTTDCSARLEQAVLQHDKQVEESVVPDEEESKEKEVSGVWEGRWVGEREQNGMGESVVGVSMGAGTC